MKYESNILDCLVKTYGVIGNPKYVSEIIKQFIIQGKECYPNLFTYQADWLAHIDEFGLIPEYTVSYTGQHIYAPNTMEKPVKRAILKGNTLVNLVKSIDFITTQYGTCTDVDRTHKLVEYAEGDGASIVTEFKTTYPLSPSTTYYLKLTDIMVTNSLLVRDHVNKTNLTTVLLDSENKIIKFTTTNLGTSVLHFYQQKLQVGAKVKYIENIIVSDNLDSLYKANDYFEGMQSVKMPVLSSVGKNLFDKNSLIDGGVAWDTGLDYITTDRKRTPFISLDSAKEYFISTDVANSIFYALYDKNKNFLLAVTDSNNRAIRGASFIKIVVKNISSNANIQLEVGTVATTYEPYKSNILTVNEEVELRGIGDVQDTLDCLTGEVVQNIGEMVLDGSEDWKEYTSQELTNTRLFYCGAPTNSNINTSKFTMINNRFASINPNSGGLWNTDVVGFGHVVVNKAFRLRVLKSTANTISELKEYLHSNPIVVQYELAEKSIKTVDLTIHDKDHQKVERLTSFDGGTHFITSSQNGSLQPSIIVDVVTDLEKTLMVCSLEGNTM